MDTKVTMDYKRCLYRKQNIRHENNEENSKTTKITYADNEHNVISVHVGSDVQTTMLNFVIHHVKESRDI